MISDAHRPSRSGCCSTSASSSPITSPPAPSVDPGREPVLDQAEPDLLQPGPVGVQPVAVAGVGEHVAPEQRQRLAARVDDRRVRRRPRRAAVAARRARSTRQRVDAAPGRRRACSRRSPPVTRPGSPSARRSCDTFDCSVLRPVLAASAHRSSMIRSARTGRPASSASRTSSSVVLPDGTDQRAPSRRTSTGPSTATVSTVERSAVGSGAAHRSGRQPSPSARRQRCPRRLSSCDRRHRRPLISRELGRAGRRHRRPARRRCALTATRRPAAGRAHHDPRPPAGRPRRGPPRGDADLLDALVRDHLADHPDNLLAAWIAARPHQPTAPTPRSDHVPTSRPPRPLATTRSTASPRRRRALDGHVRRLPARRASPPT